MEVEQIPMVKESSNVLDFDEASKAWRKNKVHLKGGAFSYKCMHVRSNGKVCNKINCKSALHVASQ